MSKFSPSEIDALLNTKSTLPHEGNIPANFFEDMEKRILAATTAKQWRSRPTTRRRWMSIAAAVMLLLVCSITLKHAIQISQPSLHNYDLYAATDDMTDDNIDDLDELYEADIFLAEI